MGTQLIKNALLLATMDDNRQEIPNGGLFIRNGFIEKVGKTEELPTEADEIIDLSGHVVLPGLINTHHHFYQTLTRAVPGGVGPMTIAILMRNTLAAARREKPL